MRKKDENLTLNYIQNQQKVNYAIIFTSFAE